MKLLVLKINLHDHRSKISSVSVFVLPRFVLVDDECYSHLEFGGLSFLITMVRFHYLSSASWGIVLTDRLCCLCIGFNNYYQNLKQKLSQYVWHSEYVLYWATTPPKLSSESGMCWGLSMFGDQFDMQWLQMFISSRCTSKEYFMKVSIKSEIWDILLMIQTNTLNKHTNTQY